MRTLAFGDIHGATANLDALLAAVAPTPDDWLIFLGDYVDRGPDSKGVLDRLIALKATHRVVCLRGNHELMMLQARTDAGMRKMWLGVGGMQCLASYSPTPGKSGKFEDIPPSHWEFLKTECVDWLETETHIFAHAGVDPHLPMRAQTETAIFWDFLCGPIDHVSGKTLIVGHTSQKSGNVLDYGCTVCIDTHAYGGGFLTCLDANAGHYWQADALGRVREGDRIPN
jgi:serine/threonine protein phosphatase 1